MTINSEEKKRKGINTKKWLRTIRRLAWVVLIYFLTPKGYVIMTQLIHFLLFFIGYFLEKIKPPQDDNRTIMEVLKDYTWAEWVYIPLFFFLILYKIPSYFAPKGFCIIYSLYLLYILNIISLLYKIYIRGIYIKIRYR